MIVHYAVIINKNLNYLFVSNDKRIRIRMTKKRMKQQRQQKTLPKNMNIQQQYQPTIFENVFFFIVAVNGVLLSFQSLSAQKHSYLIWCYEQISDVQYEPQVWIYSRKYSFSLSLSLSVDNWASHVVELGLRMWEYKLFLSLFGPFSQ